METPDSGASSYEDYFSPENLQERTSGNYPSGSQPLSCPAPLTCRSLSQRERANILEMSDLTCIGEKPRVVSLTNLNAKANSRFQSPACVAAEDTSAAETRSAAGRLGITRQKMQGPQQVTMLPMTLLVHGRKAAAPLWWGVEHRENWLAGEASRKRAPLLQCLSPL